MPEQGVSDVYMSQEYLTPGARETVELIEQRISVEENTRILEIAFGKGTTAMKLAQKYACSVVGVDAHPFVAAVHRGVRKRVLNSISLIRGDGGALPLRDASFDAAICIGAPSIVGTERCLAAMFRAVAPGGQIAVSDFTWRLPVAPLEAAPPHINPPRPTLGQYAATIEAAGFALEFAEHLPQRVWDDYYAPVREASTRLRAANPDAPEDLIEAEFRAYDAGRDIWAYSVFFARRP
jgi:ubiquinone/menaquinone biosynthesis C-methylase UbiE